VLHCSADAGAGVSLSCINYTDGTCAMKSICSFKDWVQEIWKLWRPWVLMLLSVNRYTSLTAGRPVTSTRRLTSADSSPYKHHNQYSQLLYSYTVCFKLNNITNLTRWKATKQSIDFFQYFKLHKHSIKCQFDFNRNQQQWFSISTAGWYNGSSWNSLLINWHLTLQRGLSDFSAYI